MSTDTNSTQAASNNTSESNHSNNTPVANSHNESDNKPEHDSNNSAAINSHNEPDNKPEHDSNNSPTVNSHNEPDNKPEHDSSSCPSRDDPDFASKYIPYEVYHTKHIEADLGDVGKIDLGTIYLGGSAFFHGGQEGYVENIGSRGLPTDQLMDKEGRLHEPQKEFFYDESGKCIDSQHPYAGMGGTANYYLDNYNHSVSDPGGIWHSGPEAFATSMEYYVDHAYHDSLLESAVDGVAEAYHDSLLESAIDEISDFY